MCTAVVTYENRTLPFKSEFRTNHANYCAFHQYTYISYDTHPLESTIPPYWLKIFIVRELLDAYDTVMWVDSDTRFESQYTSIDSMYPKGAMMSISADKPQHRIPSKINTGVFIVKKQSIPLMDTWLHTYRPSSWYRNDDGTWKCSGIWAGKEYEQGALLEIINETVHIQPWYILNNHPLSGHMGYVQHFCGAIGKRMLKHR